MSAKRRFLSIQIRNTKYFETLNRQEVFLAIVGLGKTKGDGTVRFWHPHTGKEAAPPLIGHKGQVWQAAFSPVDGEQVLVTLGGEGSAIWWDLESRTPLAPALRAGVETESMALSPDGQRLYLASFDEKAHMWKLPKGSWIERARRIANRSLTPEEWKVYLGKGIVAPFRLR